MDPALSDKKMRARCKPDASLQSSLVQRAAMEMVVCTLYPTQRKP